jgi:hypothetical protein
LNKNKNTSEYFIGSVEQRVGALAAKVVEVVQIKSPEVKKNQINSKTYLFGVKDM